MILKRIFFTLILLLVGKMAMAQDPNPEKDSTHVYDKIETFAEKHKFTKTLHRLIFKQKPKKIRRPPRTRRPQNYKPYEGKIIRNISIESLDPFGLSITDTTKVADHWFEKTGNSLHISSRHLTIRNLLLFKKHTLLDTLLLNESKRLIRSQKYVRQVLITVVPLKTTADSVDVSIKVMDNWSIVPNISLSSTKTNLRLKEANFLGLGHEVRASITRYHDDGENAYNLQYTIPNFKNTYINTTLGYEVDIDGYFGKFVNIEKTFYSPFTKWAGGIYLDEQLRQDSLPNLQGEYKYQNLNYTSQDFWAGLAFQLFEGNTVMERTTNFVSSIRFLNVDYKERPSAEYDSIGFFANETFYMGRIGIASRQFVVDEYIFNDGIAEDIPVGTIYALTGGYQKKNYDDRLYFGAKVAYGNYYNWGYLSTNVEFGTFLNHSKIEQTAYSFDANYFTNLIDLGERWKMRQFAKSQLLIGTNRLNSVADRISINQSNRFQALYRNDYRDYSSAGIQGFDSDLIGTKKLVLGLQTQFYSPWNIWGFRLNPYINFTTAMLGDDHGTHLESKLYSSFGLGLIIRNDYLVFSSFQLSISFYPTIPGDGNNIFKFNAFQSDDFGFQNFEVGKPKTIRYQ